MGSLMFLAAVIAIVLIVVWNLRNDRAPTGARTRGILAVLPGSRPPEEKTARTDRRGRPVRRQPASERDAAARGKR